MTPELLDLVDENDRIIATLPRSEIYAKGLHYVRTVEIFVVNDRGELWIPVRLPHLVVAPNGFDIGAGGHVTHGDTWETTFRKEVREELGWDIDRLTYRRVGKFGPRDGLNTISVIYEIRTAETPALSPDDFSSAAWLPPEEVARRIRAGHPAKSNLIHLLRHVYGVR